MNMMIAAVGVDSGFAAAGGTAEGALFVAAFAFVGFLLFAGAGRLLRHGEDSIRYTIPRL